MSRLEVQLAFQGGGAKLIAMLPVADAFSMAQQKGLIRIKAVSGTSAGSICAALIAADADFEKVRKFLVKDGSQIAKKLVPTQLHSLSQHGLNGSTPNWWNFYANRKFLVDVFRNGSPAFNAEEFETFLKSLLTEGTGSSRHDIEKLSCKLFITASDIVRSKGVIHETGDLVQALADSASLPVLLRSFGSLTQSYNVDGGLCDNLPVEPLLADSNAPVFAVYPRPDAEPQRKFNFISYLMALFSASINHNVVRSKRLIDEAFLFEVQTELGMLDFNSAISQLNNTADYELRRREAFQRIENFAVSAGVIRSPSDVRVMNNLSMGQYQQAIMRLTDNVSELYDVAKYRLMIRINASTILKENELEGRKADAVTRQNHIKARCDHLRFYRGVIPSKGDNIIPTVWSAKNLTTKTDLEIHVIPLSRSDRPGDHRKHCLIEFRDPDKIKQGHLIEITGVYHTLGGNDLSKLNARQPDYLAVTNMLGQVVHHCEMVVVYNTNLGTLSAKSRIEEGRVCRRSKSQRATPSEQNLLGSGEKMLKYYIKNFLPDEYFGIDLFP